MEKGTKNRYWVGLTCFFLLIFIPIVTSAQIPQKINYQGYLTDSVGMPINGPVLIVFSIYDVPMGGTALWNEALNVSVSQGLVQVVLGDISPVNLGFDTPYYFGIKVGSDPEMMPRSRLVTVPYAFRARYADTVALEDTSVTSSKIADGAITSGKLSASSVTESKLSHDATLVDVSGGVIGVNVGTTAHKIVQLDGTGKLPAVDGSQLTNVTVTLPDNSVTSGKIADGGVTTDDLANNAVTGAKIASGQVVKSINTLKDDVILSQGDNITIGQVGNTLTISATGGGNITAINTPPGSGLTGGQPTGDVTLYIADGGVTASRIADNSVNSSKIQDGAVGTVKLSDNAVTNTKIVDGAVTESKLSHDSTLMDVGGGVIGVNVGTIVQLDGSGRLPAVDGSQLLNLSITLLDNSVTTPKLQDGAVTGAKMASNAISTTHLSNQSVTLPKVNPTGAVSGQSLMYDGASVVWGNPTSAPVSLPYSGTASSSSPAFSITNTGEGGAGVYQIINPSNTEDALFVRTMGTGSAGYFEIDNALSTSPALQARTNGTGEAGYFEGNVGVIGTVTATAFAGSGAGLTGVNADMLDGQHATEFAPLSHNHDAVYVNEGQANSITAVMIQDGAVTDAKITGPISSAKLGSHNHSGSEITSGTVADTYLSANASLLNNAQTFTGVKTFNPSAGTIPFAVDVSKTGLVTHLNADMVDGKHSSDFIAAGQPNSFTTLMIQDGAVTDIKITGPISSAKLGSHNHSGSEITSGTVADTYLSANVSLLNNVQTFTGVKTFNPSSGIIPFAVEATKTGVVNSLNADMVDGKHASDFSLLTHNHDALYVNEGQVDSITNLMLQNGAVTDAKITGPISASKIGSVGLNADTLDGIDSAGFVKVSGDTMTGTLHLPANGLEVGTAQMVVTGSKVGIGTATPNEQLEIAGNVRIPKTTSSVGIIKSDGNRFIHNYGDNNFFAGVDAGNLSMTGNGNTGVGYLALNSNSSGSSNTASGQFALGINTTGSANTAFGGGTLANNTTGFSNTAIGGSALNYNTTGTVNTACGALALQLNSSGIRNTAIGYASIPFNSVGNNNTAIGAEAGAGQYSSGSGNVFLGYKAGYSETGSNRLHIANSDTSTLIYGQFDTNRVCINCTNPTTTLQVNGDARMSAGTGNLFVESSGGSASSASIRANNTNDFNGMAAYLTNNSTYGNTHLQNSHNIGEVLVLQSNGGDFLRAVDLGWDAKFRFQYNGTARADVGWLSGGADFAEMLSADDGIEPGDVLVIGPDGKLEQSSQAYQSTVVGVYSTKPGFVGGYNDKEDLNGKVPLAVIGVVPVKASAENGLIRPGDLLTTASTPGHVMRCQGVERCFGRTIGKALEGLHTGTGVIKLLVLLQ